MVQPSLAPRSQNLNRRAFVAAGALGSLTLAACSSQSSTETSATGSASASASPSASPSPKFAGKVQVLPAEGTTELNPLERVTVTTSDSTLTKVTLATAKGQQATGELSEDGKSWTSSENLLFHSDYTLTWEATDAEGVKGKGQSKFSTISAAYEVDTRYNVVDGGSYGTGQILEFNFSEPILNKAAVEERITITGGGDQPGKFRWYSDYMVRYRPQDKWTPNSTITVKVDIFGLEVGGGMVGNHTTSLTFKTWNKRYALADNNTKTIKMYVDDVLVREALITLGNTAWPSVVGQLPIIEQAESYYFNPGSLNLAPNDPHYYEPFWASWTSRLTGSGVFVHQALPSAWPVVGVANVSHGCIGMLPADAQFFFKTFGVGDIVETVNTGYPQADPDDGYGDWNIPFANYDDENWKGNW